MAKKEKTQRYIAIDYNTTPIQLFKALRFMAFVVMFVAWLYPLGVYFLYFLAYLAIFIVLFSGLDLRRKGVEYGDWIYLILIGTLASGTLAFSENYFAFLMGGYAAVVIGIVLTGIFLEREMEKNGVVKEVFESGYIGVKEE